MEVEGVATFPAWSMAVPQKVVLLLAGTDTVIPEPPKTEAGPVATGVPVQLLLV